MALYTFTSEDEFNKLNRLPSRAQTEMYNTLSPNTNTGSGNDNFFTKRWKSIDNAVGTTGAAAVSAIDSAIENQNVENRLNKWNNNINDIYKKYGYENKDAYYDAKDAAETETFGKYGYDIRDYGNKRAELFNPSGEQSDELKALEEERNSVINKMSQEDVDKIRKFDTIQNELINQANANSNEAKQASDNWRDYRENSDVGKRVNQDRGKFLGSAINTLSTATDLAGITNGPLANAIQGGVEGIADELEQNGLENFDWGRAGQNALVGAASGAATGMLNNAIDSRLAGKGGNLFKGNNALTNGINNFNQNTGLGRLASTLGTGMARGAQSGAVGGAVGAGLSSAMNGAEVGQGIANALQGAMQGAGQGAVAGGAMAGANMVINKTPGINRFMQDVNEAKQNWQNSGDNFAERLNNTRANNDTWGNRFLNNRIEDVRAVKQGFKDVGEGLGVLAERGMDKLRNMSAPVSNQRLAYAGAQGENVGGDYANYTNNKNANYSIIKGAAPDGSDLVKIDNSIFDGVPDDSASKVQALKSYLRDNMRGKELPLNNGEDGVAYIGNRGINKITKPGTIDTRGKVAGNLDEVLQVSKVNPNEPISADEKGRNFAKDGFEYRESYVDVDGDVYKVRSNIALDDGKKTFYTLNRYADNKNIPDQLGKSSVESLRDVSDSILPQTQSEVKVAPQEMPQDIQNMRVVNNTDSPETAVYRALTGETSSSPAPQEMPQNIQRIRMSTDDGSPEAGTYRTIDQSDAKQRIKDIKAEALRNRAAEDLLNQVGTATAPAAKADNMIENVKLFMNEGLTKPEEWRLASDAITGANGVVSKMHRNLVAEAGNIDTFSGLGGKYGTNLEDTIDYYIKTEGLTASDAKGVKNEVMGIIESLPSRTEGTLDMADSAEDVMVAIRKLEARKRNYLGQDSRNYQNPDPRKDLKAAAIGKVASMLENRIYEKVPDVSKVVTPEALQELKSYFPNNEKWAKSVDETFSDVKTGKDLRGAQKRFVQTSDYLENVKKNYGTYGQKVGDVYGNALSQAVKKIPGVGGILAQATNTPFMNRMYADINSARADRLEGRTVNLPSRKVVKSTESTANVDGGAVNNPGGNTPAPGVSTPVPAVRTVATTTNYNPATQVYNTIGRTEGAINADNTRAAGYISEAAQDANTLEDLAAPANTTSSTSVYNSVYGNSNGSTPTFASREEERAVYFFPPTGNARADMLSRALRRAKNAEDYGAMDTLYSMYLDAVEKQEKNIASQTKLTDKQRQANAAQRALNDFEQVESNFAYDVSDIPIIGGLANLGGNEYASKAEALALQVGYMLSGATVNKEEAKNIGMAYVPQPRDSEAVRQSKLRQLRGIIADYQQTYGE